MYRTPGPTQMREMQLRVLFPVLHTQTQRINSHKHVPGRKQGLKIMDVLLPTLNGAVTSHFL